MKPTLLRLGSSTVNLSTGSVTGAKGHSILAIRERELLAVLAEAGGDVVPREAIGGPGGSRAADMAISRLRRSLGEAGASLVTVRGRGYRLETGPTDATALDLGWGRLELDRRRATIGDRSVRFTEQQGRLLVILAERPGRPVERSELARRIWGTTDSAAKLDMAVHKLRRRLEHDPSHPRFVVSVRGRGLALLDARPTPARPRAGPPRVELLGRESELEETLALLGLPPRRALLHGPPGIGKSALAAGAAARWLDLDPARSHLRVDLHGVRSEAEASGRLAASLGMEAIDRDDTVCRSLARRGVLILLIDGALPERLAERLASWVDGTPTLHLLVAARASSAGWPVVELAGLDETAARALLERAAGRSLDAAPARIRRRVEGNPLALELIGRSLRSVTADVDRLVGLPLADLRDAWLASLQELDEEDRAASLCCSLFRRPFEVSDLASVAGLAPAEAAAATHRLTARSILRASVLGRLELPHAAQTILRAELRRAGLGRQATERYRSRCHAVLEHLVRTVGSEGGPALDDLEGRWPDLDRALDPGETGDASDPALLARLAREAAERAPRPRREGWATALAEAGDRADLPPGDRAECLRAVHALRWSDQPRTEREALLTRALRLAEEADDAVLRASISAELASVVAFSWGAPEAHQLLRSHPMPEDAPVAERIRHHRHVGRLGIYAGRPRVGIPRLDEAVALAEEAGLPLLEARCRVALGQALSVGTLGRESEFHLRRAIALTAQHGLPEQHVRATLRLAQHLLRLGLRGDAAELLDRATDAAVRAGLRRLEEQCVSTLGYLLIGQGRIAEALGHLERALDLGREHGGQRALFVALVNRGLALSLDGRPAQARQDLQEALSRAGTGGGWYRAMALAYRAVAELLDDEPSACTASIAESRTLLADLEHPDAGPLLEALGRLSGLASGGDPDEVARWAEAWTGGAEVEGVVLGVRRAAEQAGAATRPGEPP